MVEHPLLVQVDQYAAGNGIPDSGVPDLARLEYNVAVRQYHRRSQRLKMRHGGQCTGIYQRRKWVFQQILRHAEQLRIVIETRAEQLQGAQVVREAELLAPVREYLPVAGAFPGAERLLQAVPPVHPE